MKNTTENTKIVLGHNGAKGYEIKSVMSSQQGNDVTEVYVSRETYDNYINSGERDKEASFAGFSGEADEIIEEIEALNDIDTQLFGLHSSLEYAENLPYEQMREEIQQAMRHINSMRAEHRENTQSKLDELKTDQLKEFKYQPHENLIDNASKQLSEFYHVPFMDARGAMEQALKGVETHPLYNGNRDSTTNKIDFEEVVKYATRILNPLPF